MASALIARQRPQVGFPRAGPLRFIALIPLPLRHPIALIASCAALGLPIWLIGAGLSISAPRALEYGEPYIVSAAYYAAQDGRLYAPIEDLPFLHNNYNPLVQTVIGPWLAAAGPSFVPGRTLTALSFLGLLVLLFMATRRAGLWQAITAATLPLGASFLFPWTCLGRVDVVATMFSVATAVLGLAAGPRSPRRTLLLLSLAWLAFSAKQSALAGIGAVCLCDLLRGEVRRAFWTGGLFAVGVAALIGLFQLLSDGQYWLHAVVYMAEHERGPWWPEAVPPWTLPIHFGPGLALLTLFGVFSARRARTELVYTALALVWSLFLVRKSGSHVHYLLEPVVAASLAFARGSAAGFGATTPKTHLSRWLVTLCAALLLAWSAKERAEEVHGLWRERQSTDGVPALVRQTLAESERPSLLLAQAATLAIEAGRPAIFDIADFARLVRQERFDPKARLLALVQARAFPVIAVQEFDQALPQRRYFAVDAIPGLQEAILEHYTEVGQGAIFPRGRAVARFYLPRP